MTRRDSADTRESIDQWCAEMGALLRRIPEGCEVYAMDDALFLLPPDGVRELRRLFASKRNAYVGHVSEYLVRIGYITDSGGF